MYIPNNIINLLIFSDKLGELIPSKMAQSKRKGEFAKRILAQYEQISQEDISDHDVSCTK